MEYLLLIIGVLSTLLGVGIIYCVKLNNEIKNINEKLSESSTLCHSLLYSNCVLSDKLEKIKNLNLIDYNNNDYYKELLTTEIK